MKVAVLGCGPSGLLAAHAASERNCEVTVYSKLEKSKIHGAQYVHCEIPAVTSDIEAATVSYAKIGDASGYARKVYGDSEAPTSWQDFSTGDHKAYPMPGVYDRLWEMYKHRITEFMVNPYSAQWLSKSFDLVISTIPRQALCDERHEFRSQKVYFDPYSRVMVPNMVLYNGRDSESWYRTSLLFGEAWTEYSDAALRPNAAIRQSRRARTGIKPLDHNCTCNRELDNIIYSGRFGRWQKGILVHHSYDQIARHLDAAA